MGVNFDPPPIATVENWRPDALPVYKWRMAMLKAFEQDPVLLRGALEYYRHNKGEFILHWVDTYDPRVAGTGRPARMPFLMFRKQIDLCNFLDDCVRVQTGGLVEKARDMGATWGAGGWSVAAWLFEPGAAIGWGSRKQDLVDRLGDPDSIFEKMRMIILGLPRIFWPKGFRPDKHMTFMKIVNPYTEASITGEAGDNIGRGGRKLIYFKDESAHYPRPELIEAALGDNTNCQIDISSVNGPGNIFYRRRMAGKEWNEPGDAEKGKTAVFVMDWRDHPGKDEAWYNERRKKAEDEGLLTVFAQEVDRDYFSTMEGVIIPAKWVKSAVDAHVKLQVVPVGPHTAGLDVADGTEGGDTNACSIRKGFLLKRVDEWGELDTGKTTRRALALCREYKVRKLEYDVIGVGSGVKAEVNRLRDEGKIPRGLIITPWNAGGEVLDPYEWIIPGDEDSMQNEDFFENLKAQAWWKLRRRFEITHRALTEPDFTWDPKDIISLDSEMPNLQKIMQELSQPTFTYSQGVKLMVDKKPDGTPSPNLADSIVENFWPVPADTTQFFEIQMG